jgi:multidrug efflux pump subunit AcrA (membrane-fusion protein)
MATVVNDSQSIDPKSGALLVQLQLDNGSGKLKSGQYVQAEFKLTAGSNIVTLPASSLMYGEAGPQVATVDVGGRVRVHSVTVGKDFGTRVQIASGVAVGEKVIDSPPDALANGDKVKVAAASKAAQGG